MESAIQAGCSSFRDLARIAGTIISAALPVDPISRLLTRQMNFAIETKSAWENVILLELTFWYCNIEWFSGYSIKPPLATHIVLFSDSSGIAFGAFSSPLDGTVMNGMWKPEDKQFIVCCFFTLLN